MNSQPLQLPQLHELLYQALETELGGIQVYENALKSALNADLRQEWSQYLSETIRHRDILLIVFNALGLDPDVQTHGRRVVAHLGGSLVTAIQLARHGPDPKAAEIVAGECVCLAETKDHLNWELIGQVARQAMAPEAEVLRAAYEQVETQEDRHLYHTKGWTRELWMRSLGLPAVLPPPEEIRDATSAIQAAKAEKAREDMLDPTAAE